MRQNVVLYGNGLIYSVELNKTWFWRVSVLFEESKETDKNFLFLCHFNPNTHNMV